MKRKVYLHDIGVVKTIGREHLKLQLIGYLVVWLQLVVFVVILIADQVGHDERLADVYQEVVSQDNRPLKLCKSSKTAA